MAHKYGMKYFICVWKNVATCANLKCIWPTSCRCGTDHKIHWGQQNVCACVCVCVWHIQVPGLLVICRHPPPQVVCTIMTNRNRHLNIFQRN